MHFSPSLIVAILGTPYLALAQSSSSCSKPNCFNIPSSGLSATAGQPLTLTWSNLQGSTVSLVLRSGNSGDLSQGTTIASNIQNSGSYTWDVPSSAVRGSSYTVEIVDDSDPSTTNYTPPFILESNNLASSSASSSGTATSSGLTTSTSGASSASSSGSSSMSMTGSSTSGSQSSSATGSMTSSGSSSMMTASSTSQQSGLVASGNPTASSSQHSNGGSARATVAAGMLGMVALGALAL